MADNILDQFFISIGWDTSGLAEGDKKIREQTKRTRDEARKDAGDVERTTQRAASGFRQIRNEVSGLFLAFAGANSIKGFITEMITGAAAAGRLADNLGISIEKLSGVRSAVRSNGGTNADADSALGILNTAFQSYQLTGTTGKDADFQGLGVTLADLADPTTALLKMAQAGERLTRPEFAARLARIGLPPSVITSLAKGRAGFEALTEEGEKNANLHKQDAEAAQKFDKALNDLITTIKGQAQPWMTKLAEAMDGFLVRGGAIEKLAPIVIAGLGGIAIAAALAAGPWIALAAAIGSVILAFETWNGLTKDEQKQFYADRSARLGRVWDKLKAGDFSGAFGEVAEGFSNSANMLMGGGVSGAPRGGASGDVQSQYGRLAQKYGKFRADAIWHGIGAESNWDPNASLKDATGEAYGLGQWRGSRLKGLRQRYGMRPTAEQQIDYLMWEIDGGDQGGASVRNARSYEEALSNYIGVTDGRRSFGFMRPSLSGRAGDLARAAKFRGGAPVGATTTNSQSVSVGQIIVYSPDPDRAGVAVQKAIQDRGLVTQAGTGMQQ